MSTPRRLIVGISGASGVILGIRLLEVLRQDDAIETHLVLTEAARITIAQETDWPISEVEALADVLHKPHNIGASIASGSFPVMGMVVVPCSIKSLSNIALSSTGDLLARAADVQLKEGRPLLLVVRETPLHLGHLRLMTQVTETGAVVLPPLPAFYHRPKTLEDIIDQSVNKALDQLGVEAELFQRWSGNEERDHARSRR